MDSNFDRRGMVQLFGVFAAELGSSGAASAQMPAPGRHKGINNIFDLMEDPIVAGIVAGTHAGFLDSYFQTAIRSGGTWFFPAGTYHVNNTLSLTEGVEFWGAGIGKTIIFLEGEPWGMEQLNPHGTVSVEGFKTRDITYQISNNGIRWNSADGGYSDEDNSQFYILRPLIERCQLLFNNVSAGKIGVQFNKCFNGGIDKSQFTGFAVQINYEGSDINFITHTRLDRASDGAILCHSHGTFGSSSFIQHCDINEPKNYFIRSTDLDLHVIANHMELDSPRLSTGAGGNMEAAIDISGSAFHNRILHNRIQLGSFADNWLRVTADLNRYCFEAFGNSSSGRMGNVHWAGDQPYFNNAGKRVLVRYGGNTEGETGFPMNTDADSAPLPPGCVLMWTPSRRGLKKIAYNPACRSGDMRLEPLAGQGSLIEISDFILPLKGVYDIHLLAYGTVASQQIKVEIRDGATLLGTAAVTLPANAPLSRKVFAAAAASDLKIRIWNDDTTRNGPVWLQAVYAVAASS